MTKSHPNLPFALENDLSIALTPTSLPILIYPSPYPFLQHVLSHWPIVIDHLSLVRESPNQNHESACGITRPSSASAARINEAVVGNLFKSHSTVGLMMQSACVIVVSMCVLRVSAGVERLANQLSVRFSRIVTRRHLYHIWCGVHITPSPIERKGQWWRSHVCENRPHHWS